MLLYCSSFSVNAHLKMTHFSTSTCRYERDSEIPDVLFYIIYELLIYFTIPLM